MKLPFVLIFLAVAAMPVAVLGQTKKTPIKSEGAAIPAHIEKIPVKTGGAAISATTEKVPLKPGTGAAASVRPTAQSARQFAAHQAGTEIKTASTGEYKATVIEKLPAPVILQQGEPTFPPATRTNTITPKAVKH
ncbi:hypothetical protein CLV51_102222 [Chitinophaga niastensis]|uniref:Uncharacterized protein n=1 Tax=Chitinophaga niastensis TaxID=536980 RepID=A0A2P8HMC5_CHINA|nr:hypothetical protein [Chitinophaga niastensis]PSL47375.1 hypothetical protein CLV51_102222 [Chitinophaga niastensis]